MYNMHTLYINDDLSDFFSNFNGITAEVIPDLIHMTYVNNTVQILMGTKPADKPPCSES